MDTQLIMQQNMLCRMYGGSHAYGTNIETSDVDFRGLFFAPPECIRTPFFNLTEVSDTSEEDTKYYELTQFMKLFTLANPNILELAFIDRSKVVLTSDPYEHIRANAHRLLSKKVAFTFSGYALAQLKRVKGHNKWIANPQPVNPPRQIDYVTLIQNFTPDKLFKLDLEQYRNGWILFPYGNDLYGMYDGEEAVGYTSFNGDFSLNPHKNDTGPITSENGEYRKSPKFIIKFNKDQYKQAHETWKNYWNWKNNRNETRAALEEQFGFDTKHGMHLVRLLTMAEEILSTGEVKVLRPDADLLLSIRRGEIPYDELVKFAESKDKHIREVLYKSSQLPTAPDLEYAARLLMELQDMCWSGQVNLRDVVQSGDVL